MNKTGTSTIKSCFETLGLEPIASPTSIDKEIRKQIRQFYKDADYSPMLDVAERFKAFEDRPWNVWKMYQQLDQRFPDSLFILTLRDPELWWRSTERWITVTKPEVLGRYLMHLKVETADKTAMIASYHAYNDEVKCYFEGQNKLLLMNLEENDGWDKLCDFLGKAIPDEPFPHLNRQTYTDKNVEKYAKKRLRKKERAEEKRAKQQEGK